MFTVIDENVLSKQKAIQSVVPIESKFLSEGVHFQFESNSWEGREFEQRFP